MSKKRSELLQEIHQTSLLTQRLLHAKLRNSNPDPDLSPAQIRVIHIIKHVQPLSFKMLAGKLMMTPGAITQLLDPLIKKGYAGRIQDNNDRRINYISLTEKGLKKAEQLSENYRNVLSEALSTLNISELSELLIIQRKMLTYLEAHTDLNIKAEFKTK